MKFLAYLSRSKAPSIEALHMLPCDPPITCSAEVAHVGLKTAKIFFAPLRGAPYSPGPHLDTPEALRRR